MSGPRAIRTRRSATCGPAQPAARPQASGTVPHRAAGACQNQALQTLLRDGQLQAKLRVGPVDDPLEREADAVAERVTRTTAPTVQRKCAACAAEDDTEVRLKAAGPAAGAAGGSADVAVAGLAGGAPLPVAERSFFEPRLGRDLSAVRVHADTPGASAIGARAFTVARTIAFAPGEWRPGTVEGRRLLAHELVHVLQHEQGAPAALRRGPWDRSPPPPPPPKPPAPAIVGGVCGPDVTAETARVWKQIQTDFRAWPVNDKLSACRYLVQPFVKGGSGAPPDKYGLNADAFDTIGLYQGSARYLREPPYHPPCGVPGSAAPAPAAGVSCDTQPEAPGCDFDPGHESPATCSNTVKAGPECWLSGSVNYGTYGVMMRLCYDAMPVPLDRAFNLAATKFFAQGYKILKGDDPGPPWAWASATWSGGPSAVASGSNRPGCATTCPVPFSGPPFDYVWEPVKKR